MILFKINGVLDHFDYIEKNHFFLIINCVS